MTPPRPANDRAAWLACAALVLVALALRLHGLGGSLPEVTEEAYPLKRAWEMWGWGAHRAFDPNPHFFRYPSLTIVLQVLVQGVLRVALGLAGRVDSDTAFRALLQVDPTPFYWSGRLVTALFGAATVVPVFALARRLAGNGAAALAGLVVAISVPLLEKSQVIEVDVPLACLVAFALLRIVRFSERPTVRAAAIAGLVAGLAASAKYPGFLLALPLVLASRGARPSRGPGAPARREAAPRRRPGRVAEARRPAGAAPAAPGFAALAGAGMGAMLAAFVLTSPYVLLDFAAFRADFLAERQHMALGHFGVSAGAAWATYARSWVTDVGGPVVGSLSLVALAWYAVRRRAPWAVILAAFVVPYFLVVGSWTMKADRYLLPLLPAAAVLAGVAAADAVRALRDRRGAALAAPAWGIAAVLLAAPSLAALPAHLAQLRPDTRVLARRWIESHVPEGSFVAWEFYGPTLLGPLETVAWDAEVRAALSRMRYRAPVYAVVQLPMMQIVPERSRRFYDLALLEPADYVLVTSSLRDRYRAEPARFAGQLAFYDSLAARFAKVAAFVPTGGPGPEIEVWRNPAARPPFGARDTVPAPRLPAVDPEPAPGETFFWYNLGLVYEAYGHRDAAWACYARGLFHARQEPRYYALLSARMIAVAARREGPEAARRYLAEAIRRAPGEAQAAQLRRDGDAALAAGAVPVHLR